jgi:hypothetical protein
VVLPRKVKLRLPMHWKLLNNIVSKNVNPLRAQLIIGQKMATEIVFKPFAPLRSEGNHLEDRIEKIRVKIAAGKFTEAIDDSTDLMKMTLAGLRYLQT